MSNKSFYVYVYVDLRHRENWLSHKLSLQYRPFYVGKGSGSRYIHHTMDILKEKNHYNTQMLNYLLPIVEHFELDYSIICIDCDTEQDAFDLEEQLTRQWGIMPRGPLVNLRHGGNGGYSLSETTKKKLSACNSGRNSPNYGTKWSPERRAKFLTSWYSKERVKPRSEMEAAWAANARKYEIHSTDGMRYEVSDLTKFCAENGLPLSALRKALKHPLGLVTSKRRKSKLDGWTIKYIS